MTHITLLNQESAAIAALMNDAEFSQLAPLGLVVELRRYPNAEVLRQAIHRGEVAGAFIGASTLESPRTTVLLAAIAEHYPAHPLVGILTSSDTNRRITDALRFGRIGVEKAADISGGDFEAARRAFETKDDPYLTDALTRVLAGVEITQGFHRILVEAWKPNVTTVHEIARGLGIHFMTLLSRHYRAGVPSPKEYINWSKIAWSARLGEIPGYSTQRIAEHWRGSRQSYERTIRNYTGMTAARFRAKHTGTTMIGEYRARLIDPYATVLRTFDPMRELALRRGRRAAA